MMQASCGPSGAGRASQGAEDSLRDRRAIASIVLSMVARSGAHRLHDEPRHRRSAAGGRRDPHAGRRGRIRADARRLARAAGRREHRGRAGARRAGGADGGRGSGARHPRGVRRALPRVAARRPVELIVRRIASRGRSPTVARVRRLLQVYSAEIASLRLIARGVSASRHEPAQGRRGRDLDRAAARRAGAVVHPDVHHPGGVQRRHVDRHRLHGRRAGTRVARAAAGESRRRAARSSPASGWPPRSWRWGPPW